MKRSDWIGRANFDKATWMLTVLVEKATLAGPADAKVLGMCSDGLAVGVGTVAEASVSPDPDPDCDPDSEKLHVRCRCATH